MSRKIASLPATSPNSTQANAYPADTTAILRKLYTSYARGGERPLAVSFRDLVPWIRMGERATHHLHSYPAKLLPQIAHFFLAAKSWLPTEGAVLDPFGGSGTVALEAQLSGRLALYADANPLARLITAAKTKPVDPVAATALLREIGGSFARWRLGDVAPPWVVNIDLWYCAEAKHELASLRLAIMEAALGDLAEFVWAAFSWTARKSSRADPRFAVPVRCKPEVLTARAAPNVWTLFVSQFDDNLERHRQLRSFGPLAVPPQCVGNDARALINADSVGSNASVALEDGSVSLVLTSPPYSSAQKYVRAASLSLGWLGMTAQGTLKALENATIGREHYCQAALQHIPETGNLEADILIRAVALVDRLRAAICANYLIDMDAAVAESVRVLKEDGKVVLIIGDNSVCGMPFPSSHFLADMFVRRGLRVTLRLVDMIKSRGLLTKRSGGAAAIPSETIIVFER